MAGANDIKMYKSEDGGLGGPIDNDAQIPTSKSNEFFPLVTPEERIAGGDYYLCFYLKNTSAETIKRVYFWLSSTAPFGSDTTKKWTRGPSGKNGTEVTISNINEPPAGIGEFEWRVVGRKIQGSPFVNELKTGEYVPVWVWWHIEPVAITEENFCVKNDKMTWHIEFDITTAGTGGTPTPGGGGSEGGGGGTGGTPPPTPSDWKIAVIGDEGCESVTNDVRDMCKQYDYTISVGDHAYTKPDCWISTFSPLKPNFNSAYGNHEYEESGGIAPYKTFFNHSKTYLSFNFQNVHIVIIDSNINMDPGSAQHSFVTKDLDNADSDSSIDWIIAVLHHPWFGASSKHSYNDGNSVQAFHSLFMQHKVAFVFCGHNHNWQCTKQVAYNSGNPESPTVVDGTPPFVASTEGLIHVVSGTGGHDSGGSLYSVGSQPGFQLYQNDGENGVFELVASDNGQTLSCAFVNTNGDKFSEFVITAN